MYNPAASIQMPFWFSRLKLLGGLLQPLSLDLDSPVVVLEAAGVLNINTIARHKFSIQTAYK